MASELIVQTLKGPTSGANANKVIIPSGQTLECSSAVVAPGSILQTVEYVQTSGSLVTSSSSRIGTGVEVTITPNSASSTFIIHGYFGRLNHYDAGGVEIYIGRTVGGSSSYPTAGYYDNANSSTSNQISTPISIHCYDQPSTTSDITYELYVNVKDGGNVYYRDGYDNFIVVQEIAG